MIIFSGERNQLVILGSNRKKMERKNEAAHIFTTENSTVSMGSPNCGDFCGWLPFMQQGQRSIEHPGRT